MNWHSKEYKQKKKGEFWKQEMYRPIKLVDSYILEFACLLISLFWDLVLSAQVGTQVYR